MTSNNNSQVKVKRMPKVKSLTAALAIKDPAGRAAAINELLSGSTTGVQFLLDVIRSSSKSGDDMGEEVCNNAVGKLVELGSDLVAGPVLNTLQTDLDGDMRQFAAIILGKLKEGRAVEPLIKTVVSDDDDDVRITAMEALGKLGDNRAVTTIANVLKSEDEAGDVRYVATCVLGDLWSDGSADAMRWVLEPSRAAALPSDWGEQICSSARNYLRYHAHDKLPVTAPKQIAAAKSA